MQNLLNFLYRFRTFGFFLVLEFFCIWLIVSFNQRQNASFLNSSNAAVARFTNFTDNTKNYLNLIEVNQQLLAENEFLRTQIALNNGDHPFTKDTLKRYDFISGNVINNTFQRSLNFFTMDIGAIDGVQPGMGVVSDKGIVGQVKSVSENFSTVTSLLHRNLLVSSTVKPSNTLCTVQWSGSSPYQAEARYIPNNPKHNKVSVGDSVVTSGYNSVFPSGVLIGIVSSLDLNIEDPFYNAKIDLAMDFTSLNFAYVIKSNLKEEKDSLEFEIARAK
ncbi:MAG: rod shape-determining protein MreC [Cyclobacteriaceae bacterium]